MAKRGPRGEASKLDPAKEAFEQGSAMVHDHPLFAPLYRMVYVSQDESSFDGWARVTSTGSICVQPNRRGRPEEWAYVLAHACLHLGFEHFNLRRQRPKEWNAAACVTITRFLDALKFGQRPADMAAAPGDVPNEEEKLYLHYCEHGAGEALHHGGTAVGGDMIWLEERHWRKSADWAEALATGLRSGVRSAVDVAGGASEQLSLNRGVKMSAAQRARRWFVSSYPLLGALADSFDIIEDAAICKRLEIQVAAVDPEAQEIYFNPGISLTQDECRFVMAHELLHVGLSHLSRRQGRHPYLWNVACDYVINGWLMEMRIGSPPAQGFLFDPELAGLSAEEVYDRIANDLRRLRKLGTFAGRGMGDLREGGKSGWWLQGEGVDLDAFYRGALMRGLEYHRSEGRGLLPAGLVESIRALDRPAIPWDVELARWFDEHFPLEDPPRSYARPSRRQSATPDIPRPSRVYPEAWDQGRTFGVVLDTSGSMSRSLLGKCLGSIVSYSIAREVTALRLVFCDAAPYDAGFLPPEAIAERVEVRGRGGTLLQPGIRLLEEAKDFPADAPLLVITDGACDRLRIGREHAYLLPDYARLPFTPKGPVFRVRD